jgi:hypothetical protein
LLLRSRLWRQKAKQLKPGIQPRKLSNHHAIGLRKKETH